MAEVGEAILYSQEYDAGRIGLLESVTQVHDGHVIGAINELQDNAIEAKAKNQWIKLEEDDKFGDERVLSFLDDGNGLDKRAWSRLLGFGEKKGHNNYGVGCKSGSFSIGKKVLVFSKAQEGHEPLWGVSFFRKGCPHDTIPLDSPCTECGKWRGRFKPPVIFWRGNGKAITEANYKDGGCGGAAQESSTVELKEEGVQTLLDDIFAHSFIKSLRKIKEQFEKIRSQTGTLVLIYDLEKDKGSDGKFLEVDSDQKGIPDIRVVGANVNCFMRELRPFKRGSDIPIDYSLRAQAELLLRSAGGGPQTMIKFHIQGVEVKPRPVEDMCTYGDMKIFNFGLDEKAAVVGFDHDDDKGAIYVEFKLGFSPEAYDRELSGLFMYYDKGNGDPLRLVESYQIKAHPDVLMGMIGVVVLSEPAKIGSRWIIMDNGKQELKNGKLRMKERMREECFQRMSEYHDDGGGFLEIRGCYEASKKKGKDKGIVSGSVVWVQEGADRWWPGTILNRYDNEIMRGVPNEVRDDEGSKDRFSKHSGFRVWVQGQVL